MGFSPPEITLFGVVEFDHVANVHRLIGAQTRAQPLLCDQTPSVPASWEIDGFSGITAPPDLFVTDQDTSGAAGDIGSVALNVPTASFDADAFVNNDSVTLQILVPNTTGDGGGLGAGVHELTVHLRALPPLSMLQLGSGPDTAPLGAGSAAEDLSASGDPASPSSGPFPAWTSITWGATGAASATAGPATSTTLTVPGAAGDFDLTLEDGSGDLTFVGATFDGTSLLGLPGSSRSASCGASQPTIVEDTNGPTIALVGLDDEVGVAPGTSKTVDFQLTVEDDVFFSLADVGVTFEWTARDGSTIADTVYELSGGNWQLAGGSAVPAGVSLTFPQPTVAAGDRSPISGSAWPGTLYEDADEVARAASWGDGTAAGNVQVELDDGRYASFRITVTASDLAQNPPTTESREVLISLPTSIVVCLDYSGSMSSPPEGGPAAGPGVESKWDAARAAANRLHAVFSGIAPAIGGGDPLEHKAGYVRFWWNDSTAADESDAIAPLLPLDDTLAPAAGTLVADPDPAWLQFTPTGNGVLRSATELADGAEWRRRIIVLMTDGYHNRGVSLPDIRDASSGDPEYVPTTADDAQTGITIHTCGFGTDTHVNSAEIEAFAGNGVASTGTGKTFGGFYHSTATATTAEAARNLTEQFVDILVASLAPAVNKLPKKDAATESITIDPGVNRAVLMITTDAGTPTLSGPQPATSQGSAAGVFWWILDPVSPETEVAPGAYSIAFGTPPAAGEVDLHGVVDLQLRAAFDVLGPSHVGAELTLRCCLTDAGRPVSGADVWAKVAVPGRSDGELTTRFTDVIDLKHSKRIVGRRYLPDSFHLRTALVEAAEQRFGLSSRHHCRRPGIPLREVPGRPGCYEATFTDTSVEGTYGFEIFADGTMLEGGRFERAYGVSRYLDAVPSPELTSVSWLDGALLDRKRQFRLLIEPRSVSGFPLGSGRALSVQLGEKGETIALHDRLDGTYEARVTLKDGRPPRELTLLSNEHRVALKPRGSAAKTRRVRVVLERLQVDDVKEEHANEAGELVFDSVVAPAMDRDRAVRRRFPACGVVRLKAGEMAKVGVVVFDGFIEEGASLLLALGGREVDWTPKGESSERLVTHRRLLTGPIAGWAGVHGSDDEKKKGADRDEWNAWYRVELL